MSDNVKIALIVCATILIATGLRLYFSPFWACIRDNGATNYCTRAAGGMIPFL